jgi:uncharacterized repeat protein (TIGR01451 family)
MKYTLVLAVSLLATAAYAQDGGSLQITTVVQKEQLTVSESGESKTELVAADTVLPGDSVVYTITFVNVSDETAENVKITNPIPQHLTYEAGSAVGAGTVIEFSVDGGSVFAAAADLTVAEGDALRPARVEDYTHIRWVMQHDFAAGEQGTAQFRAQLN